MLTDQVTPSPGQGVGLLLPATVLYAPSCTNMHTPAFTHTQYTYTQIHTHSCIQLLPVYENIREELSRMECLGLGGGKHPCQILTVRGKEVPPISPGRLRAMAGARYQLVTSIVTGQSPWHRSPLAPSQAGVCQGRGLGLK